MLGVGVVVSLSMARYPLLVKVSMAMLPPLSLRMRTIVFDIVDSVDEEQSSYSDEGALDFAS